MTLPALGLIVIRSSNLDASLAFYRAIGLTFVQEQHGSGPVHYSCQLGTTVLEIYPGTVQESHGFRASGATLLGFNVASLDAVLEAMTLFNVVVHTAPKRSIWGLRAVVQDPDGRAVELNEINKE